MIPVPYPFRYIETFTVLGLKETNIRIYWKREEVLYNYEGQMFPNSTALEWINYIYKYNKTKDFEHIDAETYSWWRDKNVLIF
jgi:hypothetical protein